MSCIEYQCLGCQGLRSLAERRMPGLAFAARVSDFKRLALHFLVPALCAASARSLARRSRDTARETWRATYRTEHRSVVPCLASLASDALRLVAEVPFCATFALLGTRPRISSWEAVRAIYVPKGRRESSCSAGNTKLGAQRYSDGVVAGWT